MVAVHEHTLNVWFAENLQAFNLNVTPEVMYPDGRIDVEVRIGQPEVVIALEAEHGQSRAKQREAIKDADSRLKNDLADCAVAICYPNNTTRETLPDASLMWTVRDSIGAAENWTSGSTEQLVAIINRLPDQLGEPDAVAKTLSDRLDNAVRRLNNSQMRMLAQALDLPGWYRGKASHAPSARYDRAAKRALLVVATAVMFHSRLDSHLPGLRPEYDNRVTGGDTPFIGDWPPAMAHACVRNDAPIDAFHESWQLILALDYKPIFETACAALQSCPPDHTFARAIRQTADAALRTMQRIASLRHDLLGRVFHSVLDSARYDGSFYTTTAAATLLATLAIRGDMCVWDDPEEVKNLRITDPACGTGTLLMAAAERIYDIAPDLRNDEDTARALIEDVLVGYDVNLTATHMAATTLGLLSPTTRFQNMKIGRVLLGLDEDGVARLGSLEFLEHQAKLVSWPTAGQVASQIDSDEQMAQPPPSDLVIMNPPFTRDSLRHDQFSRVQENKMKARERRIFANKPVHLSSNGNAFLVLADYIRKAERSSIAAILPLVTATNASALEIRRFLARNYHVEYIVTSHDPERIYFSENTSIGEMLIVCRQRSISNGEPKPPTQVVNLHRNPATPADAIVTASAIGTGRVESSGYGTLNNVPSREIDAGDWGAVQFLSPYLRRRFVMLRQGKFAPVKPLNQIASVGPAGQGVRGTFDRSTVPGADGMTALWDHKTDVTQSMSAKVDAHIVPKSDKERDAARLWGQRGTLLIPTRARLNTVRMLSVRLESRALGSAWVPCRPNLEGLDAVTAEKALCVYMNSTIGVLAFLGNRSIRDLSYSQFSMDDLNKLIVPDFTALGDDAIETLVAAYDAHADDVLLPLPQMDADPARAALDDAVCAALGLDAEDVANIRRQLTAEPSITGKRYHT